MIFSFFHIWLASVEFRRETTVLRKLVDFLQGERKRKRESACRAPYAVYLHVHVHCTCSKYGIGMVLIYLNSVATQRFWAVDDC